MAFTCVAACPLAEPPEAARGLEGFDGLVTSAAAPIATGWSDQLSGQELHLLKIRAFSRRTAIGTPYPHCAAPSRGDPSQSFTKPLSSEEAIHRPSGLKATLQM